MARQQAKTEEGWANSDIGHRLRRFAQAKYKTVSGLSLAMGKHKGYLQAYVDSKSLPGATILRSLAQMGLDVTWLLTGEGEMLRQNDKYVMLRAEIHKSFSMRPVDGEYETVWEITNVVLPVRRFCIGIPVGGDQTPHAPDQKDNAQPEIKLVWVDDRESHYGVTFITVDGTEVQLQIMRAPENKSEV